MNNVNLNYLSTNDCLQNFNFNTIKKTWSVSWLAIDNITSIANAYRNYINSMDIIIRIGSYSVGYYINHILLCDVKLNSHYAEITHYFLDIREYVAHLYFVNEVEFVKNCDSYGLYRLNAISFFRIIREYNENT